LGDGTTANRNSPVKIDSTFDWELISAGSESVLAIKKDKTLWAWGRNNYGQLADGSFSNSSRPKQIGNDNNWQFTSAGTSHGIAIKTDGSLWSWGYNNYGQLGDGSNNDKNIPISVGNSMDWVLGSASNFTCCLKNDGSLWSWGINGYGQLGDGTLLNKNSPVEIPCPMITSNKNIIQQINDVRIFPNPFEEQIFIQSLAGRIELIRVYDEYGNFISEYTAGLNHTCNIQSDSLSAGIYYVITQHNDNLQY